MKQYTIYCALLICLLLAGCGKSKKAEQTTIPPTPVVATTVQKQHFIYYDDYPATIVALNEVQLHAQVAGYITEIHFTDGQKVNKGQKLYTIDQQQYEGQYNQAIANLNAAKANLDKERLDSARYASLMAKDAIARQTYDYAMASLQTAKMQVAAARANVQTVQTGLKYSNITAPLTGTIGISQVRMGAAVQPGQTLLNTISLDNPMAADFAVDERDIPRFENLLKSPTNGKDSVFTLLLSNNRFYNEQGKLLLLDRAVNQQTGTITARVNFDNKEGILKAGMTCKLRIKVSSNETAIVIPYKSVVEQMGEYFVFLVKDDKVNQVKVQLGKIMGDRATVQSGLTEGDTIVTDGVQKLGNGMSVTISAADKEAAKDKK